MNNNLFLIQNTTFIPVNINLFFVSVSFSIFILFYFTFLLASNGEYWRLLSNGVYEIWAVSQENKESNKVIIEINDKPYEEALLQNFVIHQNLARI